MEPFPDNWLWIVLWAFLTAFVLACAIGANDVANSFSISVGAKVLTHLQACVCATIFEMAGAIFLGYQVSETMRERIINIALFKNGGERQLACGCLAALTSSAFWLSIATMLKLPVSGSHSVVSATVGFTLVAKGMNGVHWPTLSTIVLSWFITPALSGTISVVLYWLVKQFILKSITPLESSLNAMPYFCGMTIAINVFSIVHNGSKLLAMDKISLWVALAITLYLGAMTGVIASLWLVPYFRKQLTRVTVPVNWPLEMSNEINPANTPTHFNESAPQQPRSLVSEEGNGNNPEANKECAAMRALSESDESSFNTEEKEKLATLATIDDCSIVPKNTPNMALDESSYSTSSVVGESDETITCEELERQKAVAAELAMQHDTPPSGEDENNLPPWSTHCELPQSAITFASGSASLQPPLREDALEIDIPEHVLLEKTLRLFSFLQLLTAVFGAFAHGGNDVSNAVSPLVSLWLLYKEGEVDAEAEIPISILIYGGIGIALGLWLWGRRVMETMGENLTRITPDTYVLYRGFAIELGAATTVLIASKMGLPVSITHCKVGSIICVGYFSDKTVDWKLFRNIVIAWITTMPVVAVLAALVMMVLQAYVV